MRIVPAKKLDELGSGKKKNKAKQKLLWTKMDEKEKFATDVANNRQNFAKFSPKFTPKFTDSNHLIDSEVVDKF